MSRAADLHLRPGGLWHKVALQLQVGPVPTGVLFLRVRDLEAARLRQRARFWRALDLMARAGLVERQAGCAALTDAGRQGLHTLEVEQLLAAWREATDAELEAAIADAPDPQAREIRERVRALRQQQREPA